MIQATLTDPKLLPFYIMTGKLHKLKEIQSIHTRLSFDLYVKHLVSFLGFSTQKAINHVLESGNDTHLKFPVQNICDYAMLDIALRMFLEDPQVPERCRSLLIL